MNMTSLADKIIALRRARGWSQEELAERLGVSRQAVSKWESAQSVPELDKVLQLSELFEVSTDTLLKPEAPLPGGIPAPADTVVQESESTSQTEPQEQTEAPICVTLEMAEEHIAKRKRASWWIAIATLLCILSPITLIALFDMIVQLGEGMVIGIGMTVLFVLVAVAVCMFIYSGFMHTEWERESFHLSDTARRAVQTQQTAYRSAYMVGNTVGILLCLFSPLPLIISGAVSAFDRILLLFVCLMLLLVGIGVVCFICVGVRWAALEFLLANSGKRCEDRQGDIFENIYWLGVTALYFAISFYTHDWHISWIIWVFAPLVLSLLTQLRKSMNQNKN